MNKTVKFLFEKMTELQSKVDHQSDMIKDLKTRLRLMEGEVPSGGRRA